MNNRTKFFFKWIWILPLLIWFVLTIIGSTEVEKKEPDNVWPPVIRLEGEWLKPSCFLETINTDVSEMIVDDRLKLIINGEIYWIRLEKDK